MSHGLFMLEGEFPLFSNSNYISILRGLQYESFNQTQQEETSFLRPLWKDLHLIIHKIHKFRILRAGIPNAYSAYLPKRNAKSTC